MRTKRLLLWMLLVIGAVACKYDDDALWDKVNSLDDRIASLEERLNQMNSDITSMSTIVNALENSVTVSNVKSNEDGSHEITFSDGKKITIKNGKDGVDAPIIGIDQSDGVYYWTQTVQGTKSWLTDAEGNKIPVAGASAITPRLKVGADDYWMVSYDNGVSYTRILDDNGKPVKAVGRDGADGSDGSDGDSFFRDVKVEDGELVMVLGNGTELRLPIQKREELPEYIALSENLGDQIDYAILGLNGMGYFYEFQDENPNIPQRLSIYDGNGEKVNLVVNFDEEGLPENIISETFTIVLGNHVDNKCKAVIITKEGESAILEDVEIDSSWEAYKAGLQEGVVTKAVSRSPVKWVNAIVGATGCGLSIAGTIISAPTGVGAVVGWGLTSISCTSALLSIADAAGWVETPDGSATANTIIGHYANIASCASINNPVSVAACLAGLVGNVTAIADLVFEDNRDDILLGEGSLVSGNGEIKITLTWDNYADIDLHCVDPSGYHIYFGDKVSTTGGFLDYDNTEAYGPENIYFNPAIEGAYRVYLHYYAENRGVSSVNYKVAIFNNGIGQTYEGVITGAGAVVDIATVLFGGISNVSEPYSSYVIDWNNLPPK